MIEESQLAYRVAEKARIETRKVGEAFYSVDPSLSL